MGDGEVKREGNGRRETSEGDGSHLRITEHCPALTGLTLEFQGHDDWMQSLNMLQAENTRQRKSSSIVFTG